MPTMAPHKAKLDNDRANESENTEAIEKQSENELANDDAEKALEPNSSTGSESSDTDESENASSENSNDTNSSKASGSFAKQSNKQYKSGEEGEIHFESRRSKKQQAKKKPLQREPPSKLHNLRPRSKFKSFYFHSIALIFLPNV